MIISKIAPAIVYQNKTNNKSRQPQSEINFGLQPKYRQSQNTIDSLLALIDQAIPPKKKKVKTSVLEACSNPEKVLKYLRGRNEEIKYLGFRDSKYHVYQVGNNQSHLIRMNIASGNQEFTNGSTTIVLPPEKIADVPYPNQLKFHLQQLINQ